MSTKLSPWIQVFAAGEWKGMLFSEADLDALVSNFERFAEQIEPPLVLGHSEEQAFLESSGLPNAGLLVGLKRVGDKLLGQFSNVPETVSEAVENQRFTRISAEIARNFKGNGPTIRRIALLGAELPEVHTLEKVNALKSEAVCFEAVAADLIFCTGDLIMSDSVTVKESKITTTPVAPPAATAVPLQEDEPTVPTADPMAEMMALIQGLSDRLAALEGGTEAAAEDEEEELPVAASAQAPEQRPAAVELASEIETFRAEMHAHKVDELETELIRDRKITPAQVEAYKPTWLKMSADDFKGAAVEARKAPAMNGEQGKQGDRPEQAGVKSVADMNEEERTVHFTAEYEAQPKVYKRSTKLEDDLRRNLMIASGELVPHNARSEE